MNPSIQFAKRWTSLPFLGALAFIALSMHLPVSLFTAASHDDGLFINNAYNIIVGHWLGSFNQLTLAKGPGYSLFLAINSLVGIPVTLSIAISYAVACWVFVTALNSNGVPRALAVGLFLALLFQPALLPTRIIRDNVYPALTLLSIAGIISVGSNQCSTAKTILFGVILGFFWITREEGMWLLPGIALYLLCMYLRSGKPDGSRRRLIRHLGVYGLAALMPSIAVSGMNYLKYGTFEVVDFTNGPFEKTLRRLNSVVIGNEIPYVPVPREKRELIYKISPAFQQLEDYFENTGRAWTLPGCQAYPAACGDYAGGWFLWALRDALASKGHYRSPQQAKAFYKQISAEIGKACRNGTLRCRSSLLPFLPAIPPENLAKIPATVVRALEFSLYQSPVSSTDGTNRGYSMGTEGDLDRARLFLGNPRTMPLTGEGVFQLNGWYYSESKDWLALECSRDGKPNTSAIPRDNSPDLVSYLNDKNADAQRFSLLVMKSDNCSIFPENQKNAAVALGVLMNNADLRTRLGDGTLNIDSKVASDESVYTKSLAVKRGLASIYPWITPAIAGIGVLCYFAYLVISAVRKSAPGNLFWIASMLWLLYLTRIGLIVLIDVSSFPAVGYSYLAPILPILYAAGIASISSVFAHGERQRIDVGSVNRP